jgi:hypothetical protein
LDLWQGQLGTLLGGVSKFLKLDSCCHHISSITLHAWRAASLSVASNLLKERKIYSNWCLQYCGELTGWWPVGCGNKGDAPTTAGGSSPAASSTQNQDSINWESGSQHDGATVEVPLPGHWGPWGKSICLYLSGQKVGDSFQEKKFEKFTHKIKNKRLVMSVWIASWTQTPVLAQHLNSHGYCTYLWEYGVNVIISFECYFVRSTVENGIGKLNCRVN